MTPEMLVASRESLITAADLGARLGVTEARVVAVARLLLRPDSAHFADGKLTPAAVGLVTRELRSRGEFGAPS